MATPEPSAAAGDQSSEVARWELSLRLRNRRHELGIGVPQVMKALAISRTRWSQIENDHTMIGANAIPQLASLFRLDQAEIDELVALRMAASTRRDAWWLSVGDLLDHEQARYYGLEYGATRLRNYSATLIVGHLQTEEYARTIISNHPDVSRADRDRHVEVRMERQRRLRGDNPLNLHILMTEAVLNYEYGSPAMLCRQLRYLADLIRELGDTLEVRIIPFSAPASAIVGASIYGLLDFPRPQLPCALWEESVRLHGITEDDEAVKFMELVHEEGTEKALNRDDSLQLIIDRADQLRSRS